MKISPQKLYPTESLFSIEEKKILFFMECLKNDIEFPVIKVFVYDGNYFIFDGHHRMLAANRLGLPQIDVEVVTLSDGSYGAQEENVVDGLSAVGLTGLYDFEAVGGFMYDMYPTCYKVKE